MPDDCFSTFVKLRVGTLGFAEMLRLEPVASASLAS